MITARLKKQIKKKNELSAKSQLNFCDIELRPTKYLFVNSQQGICWPKEVMTLACITVE